MQAATQVLDRDGYPAATTNRIAERAGVSIGTLYQYFPNLDAIVTALVERDLQRMARGAEAHAEGTTELPPQAWIEGLVRRFVQLRREPGRLGRVLSWALGAAGLEAQLDRVVERFCHNVVAPRLREAGVEHGDLDRALFIAVHALLGALRAAERMRPDELDDPAFADELVALVCGYLFATVEQAGPPAGG